MVSLPVHGGGRGSGQGAGPGGEDHLRTLLGASSTCSLIFQVPYQGSQRGARPVPGVGIQEEVHSHGLKSSADWQAGE